MPTRHEGACVIVTGAASGIGRGIAEELGETAIYGSAFWNK